MPLGVFFWEMLHFWGADSVCLLIYFEIYFWRWYCLGKMDQPQILTRGLVFYYYKKSSNDIHSKLCLQCWLLWYTLEVNIYVIRDDNNYWVIIFVNWYVRNYHLVLDATHPIIPLALINSITYCSKDGKYSIIPSLNVLNCYSTNV